MEKISYVWDNYLENLKIEKKNVKHFEHLGVANLASNCSKSQNYIDWDLPFVYTNKG